MCAALAMGGYLRGLVSFIEVRPQGALCAKAAGTTNIASMVALRAITHPFAKCAKGWAIRCSVIVGDGLSSLTPCVIESFNLHNFLLIENGKQNRDAPFKADTAESGPKVLPVFSPMRRHGQTVAKFPEPPNITCGPALRGFESNVFMKFLEIEFGFRRKMDTEHRSSPNFPNPDLRTLRRLKANAKDRLA